MGSNFLKKYCSIVDYLHKDEYFQESVTNLWLFFGEILDDKQKVFYRAKRESLQKKEPNISIQYKKYELQKN